MARSSQSHVELDHADRKHSWSAAVLLVRSIRPEQWTKNLFVFAGLLFGGRLFDLHSVAVTLAAFLVFCALSGTVYLVNDVLDRESDRSHPRKRNRPVASGALSPRTATTAAAILGAVGVAAAGSIDFAFSLTAIAYLCLLVTYSLLLKHIVIVDVLTLAAGFVLRAAGGAMAIQVPISNWLLVCTTLLALFLALTKRRHESTSLADAAVGHRRTLEDYSPYLLDQMISVVSASTLIAYTAYATSKETAERLGTDKLPLTIPFVLYGIFRYLYLVHRKQSGGSPSTLLLTDRPLLVCVALWAAAIVAVLYTPLGK
jgi:4-hydroxybenzoate polyprenyltransferase